MAAKTMHRRWRATRDSLGKAGDRPVGTVCSARALRAKATAVDEPPAHARFLDPTHKESRWIFRRSFPGTSG